MKCIAGVQLTTTERLICAHATGAALARRERDMNNQRQARVLAGVARAAWQIFVAEVEKETEPRRRKLRNIVANIPAFALVQDKRNTECVGVMLMAYYRLHCLCPGANANKWSLDLANGALDRIVETVKAELNRQSPEL